MTVSVTEDGIYLGATVCREVLDDPDAIQYMTDEATGQVGLRPVDGDEVPSAYPVSGYGVRAAPVWDALGVDVDEVRHVSVDTESEDFPVIDVSEFISDGAGENANENSDAGDTSGENDDPLGVECEVCGRGFAGEAGKNIHKGQMHDGGGDADDNENAGADDEDVLDHERVETALESVGIDVSVGVPDVIRAVDANIGLYDMAKDLGISRADADELVRRLELGEALDSDDGLAQQWFESSEGSRGASA